MAAPVLNDGRTGFQSVLDFRDMGQNLVIHLDQGKGLSRHFGAGRGNGGDRVPVIKHFFARDAVIQDVARIPLKLGCEIR